MKELNTRSLKKIKGGISIWAIIATIAGVLFGAGIFDGYTRPLGCVK